MSPFKGQGANTALYDGPHLASLLEKLPLHSAIAVFEREMLARSTTRVLASRTAAKSLHSPAIFRCPNEFGVAGVPAEMVPKLLTILKEGGVSASVGADLDEAVRKAIATL